MPPGQTPGHPAPLSTCAVRPLAGFRLNIGPLRPRHWAWWSSDISPVFPSSSLYPFKPVELASITFLPYRRSCSLSTRSFSFFFFSILFPQVWYLFSFLSLYVCGVLFCTAGPTSVAVLLVSYSSSLEIFAASVRLQLHRRHQPTNTLTSTSVRWLSGTYRTVEEKRD